MDAADPRKTKYRGFRHRYHESNLVEVEYRGGGELVLVFEFSPYMYMHEGATRAIIQLGGIENYDEVVEALRRVPARAEMVGIVRVKEKGNWVVLEFDRQPAIEVRAKHLDEF